MKGIFEFEIEGKKRGFKFGTYAFAVACDQDKSVLSDLLKKIGVPYEVDGEKRADPVNIMSLLNVFYGAAVHYAKHKKQGVDFTPDEVSDWLDELGLEKVNGYLQEGLNQYSPKNSTSLAEKGETVTA
jgi:hypothetical protein